MKKVLLGTSAMFAAGLIASPAAAQLDLSFSGEVFFGAGVADEDDDDAASRDHAFQSGGSLNIDARGTADNGLEYGARIELDDLATDTDAEVDETWLFVRGSFGQVTLGDDDDAGNDFRVFAPGAGTGGFDGDYPDYLVGDLGSALVSSDAINTGDATKVKYATPSFSGFQAGISYAPGSGTGGEDDNRLESAEFENVVSIGARWEGDFSGVGILIGGDYYYGDGDDAEVEDLNAYAIGAQISFGGFTVGGQWVDNDDSGSADNSGAENLVLGDDFGVLSGAIEHDDYQFWNVGATYTTGPWTFGVNYWSGEAEGVQLVSGGADGDIEEDVFGAGISYDFLPGLSLDADFVYFDADGDDIAEDNDGWVGLLKTTASF